MQLESIYTLRNLGFPKCERGNRGAGRFIHTKFILHQIRMHTGPQNCTVHISYFDVSIITKIMRHTDSASEYLSAPYTQQYTVNIHHHSNNVANETATKVQDQAGIEGGTMLLLQSVHRINYPVHLQHTHHPNVGYLYHHYTTWIRKDSKARIRRNGALGTPEVDCQHSGTDRDLQWKTGVHQVVPNDCHHLKRTVYFVFMAVIFGLWMFMKPLEGFAGILSCILLILVNCWALRWTNRAIKIMDRIKNRPNPPQNNVDGAAAI